MMDYVKNENKIYLLYIVMERGIMMVVHSIMIALLAYGVMVFGLKQSTIVAEDRSVLLGALLLVYMVMFGHGLPVKINKNIM